MVLFLTSADASSANGGGAAMLVMMIVLIAVFYFFMIRPEDVYKRQRLDSACICPAFWR